MDSKWGRKLTCMEWLGFIKDSIWFSWSTMYEVKWNFSCCWTESTHRRRSIGSDCWIAARMYGVLACLHLAGLHRGSDRHGLASRQMIMQPNTLSPLLDTFHWKCTGNARMCRSLLCLCLCRSLLVTLSLGQFTCAKQSTSHLPPWHWQHFWKTLNTEYECEGWAQICLNFPLMKVPLEIGSEGWLRGRWLGERGGLKLWGYGQFVSLQSQRQVSQMVC